MGGMMAATPVPDMLARALEAYDAGLCVVRAKADGSKRPDGQWLQYQAQRPTRQQVVDWFEDGWPAMGTICGAVSGDLEMFELEGRFVGEIGTKKFSEAMLAAGHGDLLARLRAGILAISPSNGRHFLYRVNGSVDGNTKLAQRDATPEELDANPDDRYKTLIETRGEGGFVMLAPSHGTAHPTGKAWEISEGSYATIPTITAEERAALFEVARSFHTANPAPIAPPKPTGKSISVQRHTGDIVQWFDATVDHAKQTIGMRDLLERYGWTYEYTDRHGRDMLKRPGKDTDGISGSINDSGRLLVFSTSTGFVAYSGPGTPTPTYDQIDVLAYYEHSGDRKAAARAVAEASGIMQRWKDERDRPFLDVAQAMQPDRPPHIESSGEMRTPGVSVWDERPALAHIRDAAHSRMVAPYAVFGCIAARIAAFTPPSSCLPPTVGGRSPLSLFIALHGASGAGKSSPVACATDLLPIQPPLTIGPLGLGSGEGLVEAFMELVEETDGAGKKKKVKRQVYRGALFILDEGQMLAEIGARRGSTILPVLRTAWSGEDPGQANASIETRRTLRKGTYHVGLISLWQDKAGAALIEDQDGGTPQRFIWLPTTDPAFPDEEPDWPGELDVRLPDTIATNGVLGYNPLGLDPAIKTEIREKRRAVVRGHLKEPPLDAHRRLNKLKLAGVLAILDGRHAITLDDWRIAEHFMCVSDAVRDTVLDRSRDRLVQELKADANRYAIRDAVAEQTAAERALARAARAAHRAASATPDGCVKRDVHLAVTSRDRAFVTAQGAIDEALRLNWITESDGRYKPGKVKPQ
jgi:hypothetical protein